MWRLVRAIAAEHPGRIALIDIDDAEESWRTRRGGPASGPEPENVIRHGETLVPRLVRARGCPVQAPGLGPEGTVLITGGTTSAGKLLARHAVFACGARHLLLTGAKTQETWSPNWPPPGLR